MNKIKSTFRCAGKALLMLTALVPAIVVSQQVVPQEGTTSVRGQA